MAKLYCYILLTIIGGISIGSWLSEAETLVWWQWCLFSAVLLIEPIWIANVIKHAKVLKI